MSVAEVKETKSNLKAWIDQLSDTSMLFMLDGLRTANAGKDSWDDLSEYEKQHINAGLDDIKHGRVMSSEEFWNQLKMAEKILLKTIYTKHSLANLRAIRDYLLYKFTQKEVDNLYKMLSTFERVAVAFPKLYPLIRNSEKIRRAVLSKQL